MHSDSCLRNFILNDLHETSNCSINVNKLKRMPKEVPASYFQLLSQSVPKEIGKKKSQNPVSRVRLQTEIRNHSLPSMKTSTATFSEFN